MVPHDPAGALFAAGRVSCHRAAWKYSLARLSHSRVMTTQDTATAMNEPVEHHAPMSPTLTDATAISTIRTTVRTTLLLCLRRDSPNAASTVTHPGMR
jgi:hypothetical protein